MPIEPIENPYRVLRFDKTRRSRKVQPRDPEEKEKYHQEESKQESREDASKMKQESHEDASKTAQEAGVQETPSAKIDPEEEKTGKSKLDIRI